MKQQWVVFYAKKANFKQIHLLHFFWLIDISILWLKILNAGIVMQYSHRVFAGSEYFLHHSKVHRSSIVCVCLCMWQPSAVCFVFVFLSWLWAQTSWSRFHLTYCELLYLPPHGAVGCLITVLSPHILHGPGSGLARTRTMLLIAV